MAGWAVSVSHNASYCTTSLTKTRHMRPGSSGRLFLLIVFIASVSSKAESQDTTKQYPILFAQAFFGPAWGNYDYLMGAALNYQVEQHLFTTRYVYARERKEYRSSDVDESTLHEVALLYGWRLLEKNVSYSFSLGGSYSWYTESRRNRYQVITQEARYWGVPFEANVLLFKAKRKRFRLLGLLPVGRPTLFGGSIGVKVAGNFSRYSYAGAGMTYGLGGHQAVPTR